MTEMLNKEFSRKTFLKGGGALIVGSRRRRRRASPANGQHAVRPARPADYLPNLTQIDSWLAINADNTVIVTHGEPECGHGTPTGILMLVAEELDMDMDQMIYAAAGDVAERHRRRRRQRRHLEPLDGDPRRGRVRAGRSCSSWPPTQLGVPVASLTVDKGVVSGGGKTVTYGDLIGGKMFNFTMTPADDARRRVRASRSRSASTSSSARSPPRIDIPDKVTGKYTYVQNVTIPGMLHARVRPPARHRRQHVAEPLPDQRRREVDQAHPGRPGRPDQQLPRRRGAEGVRRDPGGGAAEGRLEERSEARRAPATSGLAAQGRRHEHAEPGPLHDATRGNVDARARRRGEDGLGDLQVPVQQLHADRPARAIADVRKDQTARRSSELAAAVERVDGAGRVQHRRQPYVGLAGEGHPRASSTRARARTAAAQQGAGRRAGRGHLSKAIGKPVRLQWMRWDQHGWDSYGPAHMYDVKTGINAAGKIVAADWTSYGQAGTST